MSLHFVTYLYISACLSLYSISCLEKGKCLSGPNPWEHPLLQEQSLGVRLWNRTLAGAWRRAGSSSTGTCPGSARWSRGTMRASVSSWMSGETGLSPAGRILSDTQQQGDNITEWKLNKHTLTQSSSHPALETDWKSFVLFWFGANTEVVLARPSLLQFLHPASTKCNKILICKCSKSMFPSW